MRKSKICHMPERGSVLFLILIAVALFAALAYAVTSSTRSGGTTSDKEHNTLKAAQLTQYPVTIRTALMRMLAFGIPIEMVAFNAPGSFGSASAERLVFNQLGGAAIYQEVSAGLMANNQPGIWNFNANFQVPGIGRDGGVSGNDLIGFLVGVSPGVCRQVNTSVGMDLSSCSAGQLTSGIPLTGADLTNIHLDMTDTYTFPSSPVEDLDSTCTAALLRQATGCFADPSTTPPTYILYSVIVER